MPLFVALLGFYLADIRHFQLIPELIGRTIEKAAASIYPIQSCYVFKAKVVKVPRSIGLEHLMQSHGGGDMAEDSGVSVKKDFQEPTIQESV